jgi:hypothetical protein
MLEIPKDVIDEVFNALEAALLFLDNTRTNPKLADQVGNAFGRFGEAIDDAEATEP